MIREFQKHKKQKQKQEKTNIKIITKNKRKTTRGRENERKMYLKLVTCWIAYMYNVALNIIRPPSTQIWIFLKPHIFFITRRPSLNTEPVNPLTHLRPIHAKNLWFQKRSGFVWTGAINWYLKDLVTVPLICWLRSALIYLQQKEISHLHSRNLLEKTATNNLTRSAYARSAYQGYKLGCVRLRNPDF